jgi:oligopeptidase B
MAGMVLMAYGSYGLPLNASFSPRTLSLLKAGVGLAIAHVRGGGELGAAWHAAGRAENKERAVEDFIAVARELSARGYASPRSLVAEGRSAGGWLAAAAAQARPELFRALVLDAPVLDLESSVLSPTLPLHARETFEWGSDPARLRSLSALNRIGDYYPLDTLVIVPLRDTLVPPLGTLEWVRRVRCIASPEASILVDPRLEDHSGPSSRSVEDEESAIREAFILRSLLRAQ